MKGFYKKEGDIYLYAPNNVYLPDGTVLSEDMVENNYGWVWFEDAPEEYVEQMLKLNEERL